ncbi:MAG TPA: hypothetical protein VGO81_08430 [Solirubrobacteraceae bacterium]|nr:hypothetical protein [Solirubrobacteraceae bacterium]
MEAVKILRLLWRHRLFVAVGVALALVVGISIAYKVTLGLPPTFESRQYTVGVASAEVLVDSPSSQVADLGGGRVRTDVVALTARARLLANLMAASPLKDEIARSARVDPRTFVASAPSLDPSEKPSTLEVPPTGPKANVLTVYFNETLPIITADAQAPDENVAARISSAAVAELGTYLKSVAVLDKVPDARKLVVDPLGAARFGTVQRGARKLYAVLAFMLVLMLWCGAIVLIARLARGWHQAAAEEEQDGDPAGPPAESPPPPGEQSQHAPEGPAQPGAVAASVDRPTSYAPMRIRDDLPELPVRPNVVA